ncbi:MAG TPA: hypothetical protein VFL99_03715 [Segeticoccus sp.]|uniref:hypothetical protein n=1 Tax=Segeticoccus sp. TaxID=2706531 RepID=UPI002D7ED034|nr:hypothetical protein [Segeticoccus sp.]HET8599408.1 hypothetical protein [Segeticoccus sp.]
MTIAAFILNNGPSIPQGEDESVTAGVGGFIVLFLLGLALYLLMRNMNARLRRMRWRAEQEDAEPAEQEDAGPRDAMSEGDATPHGAAARSQDRRDRPVDRQ